MWELSNFNCSTNAVQNNLAPNNVTKVLHVIKLTVYRSRSITLVSILVWKPLLFTTGYSSIYVSFLLSFVLVILSFFSLQHKKRKIWSCEFNFSSQNYRKIHILAWFKRTSNFFVINIHICWPFKGAPSGLTQLLTTTSSLKLFKNTFYFTLKAVFVLKIFKFLSWLFGHEEKRLD